mgnify:CR=1 FL=1
MISVEQIHGMRKQETDEIYVGSVSSLLIAAMESDTRAQIAASVLLSAYNSYEYKICVTDLVCLGMKLFDDAMNIIRLRTLTGIEPHKLIADGHETFRLLQFRHGLYAKYHHDIPEDQELRIVLSESECFEADAGLFVL